MREGQIMSGIEVIEYTDGTFSVQKYYAPEVEQYVKLTEVSKEELFDHLECLLSEADVTIKAIRKWMELVKDR